MSPVQTAHIMIGRVRQRMPPPRATLATLAPQRHALRWLLVGARFVRRTH